MESGTLRKPTPTVLAKDSNVVKIAVESKVPGRPPQLIVFDQQQPLVDIIQELCHTWNLTEPDQYALKFNMDNNKSFVSEKNRLDVKNGFVLKLIFSPAKITRDILRMLAQNTEERVKAVQELAGLCDDVTFASEFIASKGLETIISLFVEGGKASDQLTPDLLPAVVDLMDHGIAHWEMIEPVFINKTAGLINNQSNVQEPRTLQSALSILENMVLNSSKYQLVEKELTLPNLAMHLQSASRPTQQNTLALINALFLKADDSKRVAIAGTLNTRQIRNSIVMNVVQGMNGNGGGGGGGGKAAGLGNEMAHQLHVLQTLMLNVLDEKMNRVVDPADVDAQEKIKELRRIAFDSDGGGGGGGGGGVGGDASQVTKDVTTRHKTANPRDFRKLGFRNDASPLLDFGQAPPGILALDLMLYFARNQMDRYTRVVLENSGRGDEYDCPFARAAIELTKLLCEILKVCVIPLQRRQLPQWFAFL